ncbi:alpha/beta hydrolase [Geminicoccus flavidas]|uniref:alpha/beta hydrolase n=1 Tax=Geminicoccus flavidas TaxID=2506407 RepID=UPI001356EAB3|nr:alpha/beta hydrolase-fold protein [Geminicoccus flavidas]
MTEPAATSADATAVPPGVFRLAGTSRQTVAAAAGQHRYELLLAAPPGPPPTRGYPLFLVLDADHLFATAVEALRRSCHRPSATGVCPAVIAGIRPQHEPDGPDPRRRNFLPASAAPFLGCLEQDVLPAIARHFPIDPDQCTLFGHSLAGCFVLHALQVRPDLFQRWIAASPSIWADPERLEQGFAALAAFAAAPPRELRVMVAVGGWEQGLAPWQAAEADASAMASRRAERGMVDRARAFARRLDGLAGPSFRVRYEELAHEDHASVVPIALAHGLRFALGPASLLDNWPRPAA